MSLDFLFGENVPLAARLIFAFVIVMALIALSVWLLRRFGPGGLMHGARRGMNRLGVLEVAQVDAQRRLVILRRDSVEHLVMIGGPNDLLIERSIVRAQPLPAASREERDGAGASLGPVAMRPSEPLPRPAGAPDPAPPLQAAAVSAAQPPRPAAAARPATAAAPAATAAARPAPVPAAPTARPLPAAAPSPAASRPAALPAAAALAAAPTRTPAAAPPLVSRAAAPAVSPAPAAGKTDPELRAMLDAVPPPKR